MAASVGFQLLVSTYLESENIVFVHLGFSSLS